MMVGVREEMEEHMKRKRVLALFLVLSIVFSSNGITALAAGTDLNETDATVDESTIETEIETEEEETDAYDETDGTDADISEETEGEEDFAEEADETVTDVADSEEENEAAEEEIETEAPDADGDAQTDVSQEADATVHRMLSFTDEAGMTVTYDANVEYEYTVVSGVLTAIRIKTGTDDSDRAVSGTVVIEEGKGITAIGETAFSGNTDITYVKLPVGVKTIEQNAFKGCTALTGITIPSGVTSIGNSAFEGCSKLMQLAIPKTLTAIGSKAFYGDNSLFMVYMKDAAYGELKTIGDSAFYGCEALAEFCSDTEFVFPDALEEIGVSAFEGCSSIKKIVLPDSVTTIGSRVFYGCLALTDVSLSKNLENISEYAFYGCRNLVSVTFGIGNQRICKHAFENCIYLGSVGLPSALAEVQSYAFNGCTYLMRVEVPNANMQFGEESAFPNRSNLCMIGHITSTTKTYTSSRDIVFLAYEDDENKYFTCTVQYPKNVGDNSINIYLNSDRTKKANEQNGGQGVQAGTELAAVFTASSGKLVEGSLRCNGTPISKNAQGDYVFKMPKGGAFITAEFELKTEDKRIDALSGDVGIRLSNGEERSDNIDGVKLKIGQSTRLFLINTADKNSVIPFSKITYKSDKPATASVTASGMIKALKKGEAKITATVSGSDGKDITKNVYIEIDSAGVDSLKLKISSGSTDVEISNTQAMQTLSIEQTALNGSSLTFAVTATAYDESGDDLAVALKWSSSDATVVKPEKTSTTDAEPKNTFTIPKDAKGEATITVTATNTDKTVVTGKFLVSVKDYTPILASSALTFNPNQEKGTVLELIGAYGSKISETAANTAQFVDSAGEKLEALVLEYDKTGSTDTIARFYVKEGYGLKEGTKSIYVGIKSNDFSYKIPIKVTVKSSYPNPKVAWDKKQAKINLFYANDGTEIKPVITNLGNAEISEYSLKALAEDKEGVFTQNFAVDDDGIITQLSDSMLPYSHNGKPAVTGYLVLKFEGFKDYTKEYKITIPTQTVKPSYQLNKTSGTFNSANSSTVALKLIDKKTKEQIVLDNVSYDIRPVDGSDFGSESYTINDEGEIELNIGPRQSSGKLKISVRNAEWAKGSAFTYTYTVKMSNSKPKITLKTSGNLNRNYPDQSASFTLSSNQLGTRLAPVEFIPDAKASKGKEDEYEKLSVTCNEEGDGLVEILDSDINKGTYKFTCDVSGVTDDGSDIPLNKVTLSVKVVESVPTVSAKGSLSLNLNARGEEVSELTLTCKNLPENYALDGQTTAESIKCTTKNAGGVEENFSWQFEENKLAVVLQNWVEAKTYSFEMSPEFVGAGGSVSAKKVKFKVKVHSGEISLKLSAKGKLNLLDRGSEEHTQKNSIIYTPTISNLKDTIEEAKIFDSTGYYVKYDDDESEFFDIAVLDGKLYVTPKTDAEIDNNKNYKVKIWVRMQNYTSGPDGGGIFYKKDLTIKTAQTLPKLTIGKTALSLYTSNKDYEASFKVSPKTGSIGKITDIVFDEKDEKSLDSFDLSYVPQDDGSLDVTLKLKTAAYPCNTANKIKMYVVFAGQGANTKGTAITMNVTIISKN